MEVRTRFAPSPTGFLHIGSVRTALYNWLFARQHSGKFLLRIEDTDCNRSTSESISAIIDGLKWLGLDWDEGPYLQSERLPIYQKFANKLIDEHKAYRCFCSQEILQKKKEQALKNKKIYQYDRTCLNLKTKELETNLKNNKPYVVRLKTSPQKISFQDKIKGEIVFDNLILDDFIILRSNGLPVYNFSCVVDDVLMNINYVIRGDDHISNTPKQILIYRALGFEIPQFAHIPMILGEDGTRLSKRHGATALQQYKDDGYLASALINYLVRLGWSYDDKQEIFSIPELLEKFSLSGVSKSPAIFNPKKLLWLNAQYISNMSIDERCKNVIPFLKSYNFVSDIKYDYIKSIIIAIGDRLKTFKDIINYGDFFFKEKIEYDKTAYEKALKNDFVPKIFPMIIQKLKTLSNFDAGLIEKIFRDIAEELNITATKLFQAVRVALTGKLASPGILDIISILGLQKTIKRLEDALASGGS